MKTDSVVPHALGLERRWRDFLHGGKLHQTDSIISGGMTDVSAVRVAHREKGGRKLRIKLFNLVFDRTGVFTQWMFASALHN